MKLKHCTLLVLAAAALVGCNPPEKQPPVEKQFENNLLSSVDMDRYTRVDDAQSVLAETAASVGDAFKKMAQVEMAAHKKGRMKPPVSPERLGMAALVSVNFDGECTTLVKALAKAAHYRVHVLGKKPSIPAIVTIHVKNTPIADVLRDVAYQMRHKADVAIYPKRRLLELRYGAR